MVTLVLIMSALVGIAVLFLLTPRAIALVKRQRPHLRRFLFGGVTLLPALFLLAACNGK